MDVPEAKRLVSIHLSKGIKSRCLSESNDRLEECEVSRQIKDTSKADVSVICLGERSLLLH